MLYYLKLYTAIYIMYWLISHYKLHFVFDIVVQREELHYINNHVIYFYFILFFTLFLICHVHYQLLPYAPYHPLSPYSLSFYFILPYPITSNFIPFNSCPYRQFVQEYLGECVSKAELSRRMKRSTAEPHLYAMQLNSKAFLDSRRKGTGSILLVCVVLLLL